MDSVEVEINVDVWNRFEWKVSRLLKKDVVRGERKSKENRIHVAPKAVRHLEHSVLNRSTLADSTSATSFHPFITSTSIQSIIVMATNRYANNQIANNVVSTENFCMVSLSSHSQLYCIFISQQPLTYPHLLSLFHQIGTPLPSLDSKKFDPNELKPIWDQEVRDEEGRQRFHGAFTGGFSAGYFNSVGSKEGRYH